MDAIQLIVDTIKKWEGGFVNNKADKGGPTKYGITQATLSKYLDRPATFREVENLELEIAVKIYKLYYYDANSVDLFPEPIRPIMFDMYVQHRPRAVGTILQRTLNSLQNDYPLIVDGVIGSATQLKAKAVFEIVSAKTLINRIVDFRIKFYTQIISTDPSQIVFRDGWLRRANSFLIS